MAWTRSELSEFAYRHHVATESPKHLQHFFDLADLIPRPTQQQVLTETAASTTSPILADPLPPESPPQLAFPQTVGFL